MATQILRLGMGVLQTNILDLLQSLHEYFENLFNSNIYLIKITLKILFHYDILINIYYTMVFMMLIDIYNALLCYLIGAFKFFHFDILKFW